MPVSSTRHCPICSSKFIRSRGGAAWAIVHATGGIMIAIIDYGAGNIRSIAKALERVGASVRVTDDPAVITATQAVVLPGVGSGGAAMARMKDRGLDDAIRQATQEGKPF